jgi:hypothetical protein
MSVSSRPRHQVPQKSVSAITMPWACARVAKVVQPAEAALSSSPVGRYALIGNPDTCREFARQPKNVNQNARSADKNSRHLGAIAAGIAS